MSKFVLGKPPCINTLQNSPAGSSTMLNNRYVQDNKTPSVTNASSFSKYRVFARELRQCFQEGLCRPIMSFQFHSTKADPEYRNSIHHVRRLPQYETSTNSCPSKEPIPFHLLSIHRIIKTQQFRGKGAHSFIQD